MATKRRPEETHTLDRAVIFTPRRRLRRQSYKVTLDDTTWDHLTAIVAAGDAASRSQAIELLTAEHKESERDLRLRFHDAETMRAFVRFCARQGDLPATWLARKIKEAMAENG